MITPEEFYDQQSIMYEEMDTWTVAQYKIAMKFARDYGDRRELDREVDTRKQMEKEKVRG